VILFKRISAFCSFAIQTRDVSWLVLVAVSFCQFPVNARRSEYVDLSDTMCQCSRKRVRQLKKRKKSFFLDFEKNVPVGLINLQFHRPLTRSNFTITLHFGVGNLAVLTSGNCHSITKGQFDKLVANIKHLAQKC